MFRVIVLLCCCVGIPASAAEFCALRIEVITSDGKPAHRTTAELLDSSSKVVARTEIQEGSGEICDFGFGVYSLLVGRSECLPVVVQDIRLRYAYTQRLRIYLNECPHVWRSACSAYFRITSKDGKPIAGAQLVPVHRKFLKVSDKYGRAEISVGAGSVIPVTISANGYVNRLVSVSCKGNELFEFELRLDADQ